MKRAETRNMIFFLLGLICIMAKNISLQHPVFINPRFMLLNNKVKTCSLCRVTWAKSSNTSQNWRIKVKLLMQVINKQLRAVVAQN